MSLEVGSCLDATPVAVAAASMMMIRYCYGTLCVGQQRNAPLPLLWCHLRCRRNKSPAATPRRYEKEKTQAAADDSDHHHVVVVQEGIYIRPVNQRYCNTANLANANMP